MTNKKPAHVSLTKVKQFQGSSAFVKRSQWTLDQLRQVNGIDPNKVSTLLTLLRSPVLQSERRGGDSGGIQAPPYWLSFAPHSRFSSRTAQSLTWCLKMRLTSGAPVQLERSAPSSRSSTTPASATAQRGNRSSSTASPSCWGVRPSLLCKPASHCTSDHVGTVCSCMFSVVAVSWIEADSNIWCRTCL